MWRTEASIEQSTEQANIMAITYERVLVTPSLARQWLDRNAENNRNPKSSKIPQYARDMTAGRWNSETGETIKFDETGTLIDGQNRLMAVMRAGIAIEFDVARGLPTTAMQVLDSGAARTGMDVLKVANASDRARAAAIVRWVILWDEAKAYTGQFTPLRPTNTEVLERFRAESGAFDAAAKRATDCQHRGLGTGAPAGVAYYLFSRIDQEQTHGFFDQYISGANLPDGSPILALRNKMARLRVDRLTRPEQLALFVRSWNAFRKDKTVANLVIVKGDLTNLNFPQPI